MKNKITDGLHGFRWYISGGALHSLSMPVPANLPARTIKKNVEKNQLKGIILFEDGHAEACWPESPTTWSYYVSLDAALIAAELRGYHVKR